MTTKLEAIGQKLTGNEKSGYIRRMLVLIPGCEYEETWCDAGGWHCEKVHQQYAGCTLHSRLAAAMSKADIQHAMTLLWARGSKYCNI